MAVTLIINPGSSSKKYALYLHGRCVSSIRFEKRGTDVELCTERDGQLQTCEGVTPSTYGIALEYVIDRAVKDGHIKNSHDIEVVGIRVVAPGVLFTRHQKIDTPYRDALSLRAEAAPLHIPPTLQEIDVVRSLLPDVPFYAISDSAFHATLPDAASRYSIAEEDVRRYDIRRFGYHGISCGAAIHSLSVLAHHVPSRVIVCHVGSGVSVTAIKDGKSVDTTMGFSPVTGLTMGTRAGDLDAGALLELMRVKHLSLKDAHTYIQTKGGIYGIAGVADLRVVIERADRNDEPSKQALEHFIYQLQKAIGAAAAALGGVDVIVLTATAMERNSYLRARLLSSLRYLGVVCDEERNELLHSRNGYVHATNSTVAVAVIKSAETDHMYRIVQDLCRNDAI
jgi:acetate kinase